MKLGKKLATLIKATLRSGLSRPGRQPEVAAKGPSPEDDRDRQIEQVRQALEAVSAQERAVAEKLAATRQQAQAAAERGDRQTEMAQNRLAAELEAHLKTQTSQSTALARQLDALQQALDDHHPESKTVDEPATSHDDEDLTARKSRLSG